MNKLYAHRAAVVVTKRNTLGVFITALLCPPGDMFD